MIKLKIGIQLASLRMPFKRALRTAAELGADAIEIDARGEMNPRELSETGRRQLKKLLDDYRLSVSAIKFQTARGYNVIDDLDRRVDATREALKFAYSLGTNVVANSVGRIPDRDDDPEWELLVTTLTDLGRFSHRAGAMLAARTGAESGEKLLKLIGRLPEGSIAVDLDPGGLIVNGFSPRDATIALGSHIIHVRARDGVRDLAQGRGLETPLGRGIADFPELLGILEERGYRGYLTIERQQAADPVFEIGQAVKYLRSL